MPITRLDGKPVGDGKPGLVFEVLYRLYQSYKLTVMRGASPKV
jgi:D-alanine transaminase